MSERHIYGLSTQPYGMDRLDMLLLRELVRDGRASISEIARRLGVPRTTLMKRLERLVKRGVIKGFRAVVNPRALGYRYLAFILVKARRGEGGGSVSSQERLIRRIVEDCRRLESLPWIEEAHIVTGTYDIVLKVWAREWDELTRFLIVQLPKYRELVETYTMLVLLTPLENEAPPVRTGLGRR